MIINYYLNFTKMMVEAKLMWFTFPCLTDYLHIKARWNIAILKVTRKQRMVEN